jgi:hypothetical protein
MARKLTDRAAGSQKQSVAPVVWDAALAGLGHGDATARLVERLDGQVEWPELLRESRASRLTPLVYGGLEHALRNGTKVPAEILQRFRCDTMAAGIRLARLEQACAEVVDHAIRVGIPGLVLKGLALAATVYPAGIPRPMDDIDLLVRETDRERLAGILHARGFRNDLRGEEDFFHPSLAFSVDVHTALVNITRIPARRAVWPVAFEDLWHRSQIIMLCGVPVRTLGPRDTIMYLAVHAVHHHGLSGAQWMVDLLACLRAWPLALSDVLDSPPALRRSLWYGLEILAGRGQDPAPDVRAAIRPPRLFPAERWIVAAVSKGEVPEAIRYAFTLACLPRWTAKSAFFRQLLFPRTGVFTDAFKDAGNSAPSRGEHWSLAMQYCREALKAALTGRARSGKRSVGPN